MSTIGQRLRGERERLGLSQTAFAERCGVQKRAQINYEQDERSPDAAYFTAMASVGGDVNFVLFGQPAAAALPLEEQRLLALFRLAEPAVRQAVVAALAVGSAPAPVVYSAAAAANGSQALLAAEAAPGKPLRIRRGAMSVEIHGDVGQRIEGGSHPGATFSVDMGAGKRKK